ncbi:MAG: PAS domain S-box protein [Deltaproteobacteria bacterium]|uniref:PAS domain-containing sensor histidine kinase n=1 Tax=Desulfobacula sp. TaxID=2593537 RepID=UPI0019A14233|nr:PAS domain S-box protein [Candidatus Desulfobacula maris]MBL6993242.1 PAS domain S-box protein [Desulfobacula sp.]
MKKNSTRQELKRKIRELERKNHTKDELIAELSENYNLSLDMIGTGNLNGYFTNISSSFERILGYNKKELLENPFLFFVHDDDQEKTKKTLIEAQEGKKELFVDNRYRCKNGSYRWIDWKIFSVIQKNKFMAVGRDITEEKREEEQFKKIINGSIDGFVIVDINGKIIEVNKAYCQLLGYTRNEILKMSLMDFEAHLTKEQLKEITSKIIDTGGDRFESKNKTKNGDIIDVEVVVSFTPESHGTFLVFIHDITDRKRSEKALIKLNKTLDSKVKKRTDALRRLNEHLILTEDRERKNLAYELHDGVAQFLAIAVSQIKNLKEIDLKNKNKILSDVQKNIENAFKAVRILIHNVHPQILEDFNIDLVLGSLIDSHNEKEKIKIKYINNIFEHINLNETSKLTIYRATCELINNILKHSDSLVAEIELSKIKNNIQIRVEDKGIGFDIHADRLKKYSGFGLYSLSERVENMGGNLIIKSSKGKGTKITLTVPLQET